MGSFASSLPLEHLEDGARSASQTALTLGRSVPSFVLSDAFLIKTVIIGAFPKVLLGEFAFLQALLQLAFYLSLINK